MSTFLLLIAYVIDTIFTVPLTLYKSWQNRGRLEAYHFNVALHYDYKWASQLFLGYDGKSVSAIVYKKAFENGISKYFKYVRLINWLFRDKEHCINAYKKEFRSYVWQNQ